MKTETVQYARYIVTNEIPDQKPPDDMVERVAMPLREPTPEMVEAGAEVILGELGGSVDRFWSAPDLAALVYRAMIDESLK